MTAMIPAADFRAAVARSDFIDAHNAADAAVRARLCNLAQQPAPLLSQNIETLGKTSPSPQYSKQQKTKVDHLLRELKALSATRRDIVHGRMEHMVIGGTDYAFFPNVQKQPDVGRAGLLLTLGELKTCTERLYAIALGLLNNS